MEINQAGLNLIKEFEGFKPKAYICPAGVLTIGYGTTGSRVKPGLKIDKPTAVQWLKEDVDKFEKAVEDLVEIELNSNEFSALVSFTYNCGEGALASSTLLRKLNQGDKTGAAKEFDRWVKGGGRSLPGLVRRRNAEEALFLKPFSGEVQTPEGQKNITRDRILITSDTFAKKETYSYVHFEDGDTRVKLHKGTEFPVLATKEEDKHILVTFDGVTLAGKNTWYFWGDHVRFPEPPEPKEATPDTLAQMVANVCQKQEYQLNKDEFNLIGISGLYPKGRGEAYGRSQAHNEFNDSVGVIAWDSEEKEWDLLCLYQATTEPGDYYIDNPLNPNGCACLDWGLHKGIWQFGHHKGYRALVQADTVRLRRTRDTKLRDDVVSVERGNGINLHSTSTGFSGDNVGRWSAGCVVIRSWDDFRAFLKTLERSPQYRKSGDCRFDFRLLNAEWLD